TIKSNLFPGDIAFQLHDTYGFPIDLTQDILREDGFTVDVAAFNRLMEEQRERGRAARKDDGAASEIVVAPRVSSRFLYDRNEAESEVLVAQHGADERVTVVTAETPFYPEG